MARKKILKRDLNMKGLFIGDNFEFFLKTIYFTMESWNIKDKINENNSKVFH